MLGVSNTLRLIFLSINENDNDNDDTIDDTNDGDDCDEWELLKIIMLRVCCCVRCGVHSGLSSYQSNYASCNAQMNTNDCDDADSDKYDDDDDDKHPTYCPERHSYRQRRSHIGGNSSRGRHTLK